MGGEIQWNYGEKWKSTNYTGRGLLWSREGEKKKNGKILAVPNKAKSLVWPCQVQIELGWQREKKQRNAFLVVFFSLPQMENFIGVSSDFCIVLVVSPTVNCFKWPSQHLFLLLYKIEEIWINGKFFSFWRIMTWSLWRQEWEGPSPNHQRICLSGVGGFHIEDP